MLIFMDDTALDSLKAIKSFLAGTDNLKYLFLKNDVMLGEFHAQTYRLRVVLIAF
jgi:hypothetical protein